ncbi:MAG: hypothetical protein IPN38_13675 [Flavobacteriales bacterium]|nr:hypothetical protein [Flavobacteriales bacterium]
MALVHPASGRAKITATLNGELITIPPRRNWFVILFLGAWTGGWAFGGGMALLNLFKPDMPLFARGFLMFWLLGWAAYQVRGPDRVFAVRRQRGHLRDPRNTDGHPARPLGHATGELCHG